MKDGQVIREICGKWRDQFLAKNAELVIRRHESENIPSYIMIGLLHVEGVQKRFPSAFPQSIIHSAIPVGGEYIPRGYAHIILIKRIIKDFF